MRNLADFPSLSFPLKILEDMSEPPFSDTALYPSTPLLDSTTLLLQEPIAGEVHPCDIREITAFSRHYQSHSYQGEVEMGLVVERQTESGTASRTSHNGMVAIAGGKDHLAERREPSRRRPVLARVEISVHQEHIELGFVLDGVFEPAKLVLELSRRAGDKLASDLRFRMVSRSSDISWSNTLTSAILVASSRPVMIVEAISTTSPIVV